MSTEICPACGAPDDGGAVCASCGLTLRGEPDEVARDARQANRASPEHAAQPSNVADQWVRSPDTTVSGHYLIRAGWTLAVVGFFLPVLGLISWVFSVLIILRGRLAYGVMQMVASLMLLVAGTLLWSRILQ